MIAWGIGITASLLGLAAAYHWDYSVGPAVAAVLGILLLLTACGARILNPKQQGT